MKIQISYYDSSNDRVVEFNGTKDFGNMENFSNYCVIENIVAEFENICVDYGGDEQFYELNIADFEPGINLNELCKKLLQKLEAALEATQKT